MKTLKLFLTLVFFFVANAIYADATVTSPSISSYGGGTAMLLVGGTNGNWMLNSSGGTGSLANLSDVVGTRSAVLLAQPSGGALKSSQCTLTIPSNATATVTYAVAMSGSTGQVSASIGSTTINGVANTSRTGSVTLSPGTYAIQANAYVGPEGGGTVVYLTVQITYE